MKNKKEKTSLKNEFQDLADILSGELQLRKKEEKLDELKKKAVERQKNIRMKKIEKGELELDKEEDEPKKIVQKLKLYEWEAPIRFRQPFDPKTFLMLVGITLLFIMYLAVLGHYGLMGALIALLFFFYVAGTTPPINVKHEINTKGIDSLGKLYEWYMLDNFYFTKKDEQFLLVVETKLRAPAKLLMLMDKKEVKPIFLLLEDKLLYKDIRKWGKVNRMSLGEYIPIEEI